MKKLVSLLVVVLFLFGCSKSLDISDFDDTKDIIVIHDLLTDKTKKLNFDLSSIKENDNVYTLNYKSEDGSSLKFSFNKDQQIKSLEFLKDGEKRKAYGAYLKITASTLDVFKDFREDPEKYDTLTSAYPHGKGTYSLGKTIYGKCTVSNHKDKFTMSFDHK